jgi:hypothetical protein
MIAILIMQLGLGFSLPKDGALGAYRDCVHQQATAQLAVKPPDQVDAREVVSACAALRPNAVLQANDASRNTEIAPAERTALVESLVDLAARSEIEEMLSAKMAETQEEEQRAKSAKRLGDKRLYCTGHPSNWSVSLNPEDAVRQEGNPLVGMVANLTVEGKTVIIRTGTAQRPLLPERSGGKSSNERIAISIKRLSWRLYVSSSRAMMLSTELFRQVKVTITGTLLLIVRISKAIKAISGSWIALSNTTHITTA